MRRKPKSNGLAVHSSPGELGPDTAVVHPLLSAFPRRSSSSQPLVPRRERQHSTSSRQLYSDSVESAASLSVAHKAEHGKRLRLADCLFPASSRTVDRAEYLKSGVRRQRDKPLLNERPLPTAEEDACRSLCDAELLASRAAEAKVRSMPADHVHRSLSSRTARQTADAAVNTSSVLPVVVGDSCRMAVAQCCSH